MIIRKLPEKPVGENMKVLVDTNIILDCLLKRQGLYENSKRVIQSVLTPEEFIKMMDDE